MSQSPKDIIFCPRCSSLNIAFSESGVAEYVIWVVQTFDEQSGKSSSEILVQSINEMSLKQMTNGGDSRPSTHPQIISGLHTSGDVLCYLRNGHIFGQFVCGGESYQITRFTRQILHFKIFRGCDNQIWLLLSMETDDACKNTNHHVYDSLMIRQWNRWNTHKSIRRHLFLTSLDISKHGMFEWHPQTPLINLMHEWETDCPGRGFHNGPNDYCIAPNGRYIIISCERSPHTSDLRNGASKEIRLDHAWTTNTCLYMLAVPDTICTPEGEFSVEEYSNTMITEITPAMDVTDTTTAKKDNHADYESSFGGYNDSPAISGDSSLVAFLSRRQAGYESDMRQIRIYDVVTKKIVTITKDIDIAFRSLTWGGMNEKTTSSTDVFDKDSHSSLTDSTDGMTDRDVDGYVGRKRIAYVLFATAMHLGASRIFRLLLEVFRPSDVECTIILLSVELMQGDESRHGLVYAQTGNSYSHTNEILYFFEASIISAPVIKSVRLQSRYMPLALDSSKVFTSYDTLEPIQKQFTKGENKVISTQISAYIQEIYSSAPQFSNGDIISPSISQHYFEGGNDDLVHGWFVAPTTIQSLSHVPNKSIPLLLILHGGPQGATLNNWNIKLHLATFAAQGYAVFAINFHGSCSFGQSFTDSIHGDWGGKPFADCMKSIDYIASMFPYIDESRVAALGSSYGGYLVNWMNGHTDRFKCFINHAGLFSLSSFYYSTEVKRR